MYVCMYLYTLCIHIIVCIYVYICVRLLIYMYMCVYEPDGVAYGNNRCSLSGMYICMYVCIYIYIHV
jgi:hypothetical protein